jgi:hypothetical protein
LKTNHLATLVVADVLSLFSGHVEMRQLSSLSFPANSSMRFRSHGVQKLLRVKVTVRKMPPGNCELMDLKETT